MKDAAALEQPTHPPPAATDEDSETIYNLIVSVKAHGTVLAIKDVAHRLTSDSSILFLQNGMGMLDELNEQVFPDETKRPQYLVGVITHGVYSTRPFSVVHAGHGTTSISILPRRAFSSYLSSSSTAFYLLRTMARTPVLAAVGFSPTDLLQIQLEKLATNAVVNPLTAIFDCTNGELLHQPSVSRLMRLLLAEVSLVIRSLPELQGVPNVRMRFHPGRLEGVVLGIIKATANNSSSMLQDVRRGRAVEIDYINGYVVRRAKEMGFQCVVNYMIMHLVKAKIRIERTKPENALPFKG